MVVQVVERALVAGAFQITWEVPTAIRATQPPLSGIVHRRPVSMFRTPKLVCLRSNLQAPGRVS